jgi:SAM-dependent methyltransferase
LNLGDQPPANSLRKDLAINLPDVPLQLCRCANCTTVQLTDTVDPAYLFSQYVWVTGTSETANKYSADFQKKIEGLSVSNVNFVIEVASNDGTFLRRFKDAGSKVLGIDPAQNLAEEATKSGIPTIPKFFGLDIAQGVVSKHGFCDVVIARNVIPHVPDPNDVIAGMAACLENKGLGVIEFHWVDKILTELHYDSIYHEHYFYHSLHSIRELLRRHQLTLFDVSHSPISGGSLVAYFSKAPREPSRELIEILTWEERQGLATLKSWEEFSINSIAHAKALKASVEDQISRGRKLIGYGASARSSTLLNFCQINRKHLGCIADQNPLKHNQYTPGTDILILPPDEALASNPDTIVLLAWNFQEEILNYLKKIGFHGEVIIPLPGMPRTLKV